MESIKAELEEYRRRRAAAQSTQEKPSPIAVAEQKREEPVHPTEEAVKDTDCSGVAKPTLVDRIQKFLLFALLWLLLLSVAVYAEFGCVYALTSAFGILWFNTSRKKRNETGRQLSAYSVFNPNCQRLPGQITAEHFEDMYRKGGLGL
uniref:SAYSvFN domain-containing protein n=1 Tax=Trichuris muris TaxID=70415 RepID=A0A5S6QEC7_TRIMR